MNDPLYTFLFNFGDGTYISQTHADTLHGAMLAWANDLDGNVIKYMDRDAKQDLLRDVQDEWPSAIRDVVNVWMFVVVASRKHGHVYFVKVAECQAEPNVLSTQAATYTFIMNYMGGEYISQVHADSLHEAVVAWARNLEVNEIGDMDERIRGILLKKLRSVYPNAVMGVSNAWSFTIAPLGRFGLVNVFRTSED